MYPYIKGYENRLDRFDIRFLAKEIFLAGLLKIYFRYRVYGFENIPKSGPGIIVMNHGILPIDGFLLGSEILTRLSRLPRGVTDHLIFRVPFLRELFLSIGIVDGNRENAMRILKKGGLLMVMPGGAREAFKVYKEKYRLNWENRSGFIRIAQESGAPIILAFCYGIDDIYRWVSTGSGRRTGEIGVPLLMGLGLLPFPVSLTQVIGRPIYVKHNEDIEKVKKMLIKKMNMLFLRAKRLSGS